MEPLLFFSLFVKPAWDQVQAQRSIPPVHQNRLLHFLFMCIAVISILLITTGKALNLVDIIFAQKSTSDKICKTQACAADSFFSCYRAQKIQYLNTAKNDLLLENRHFMPFSFHMYLFLLLCS